MKARRKKLLKFVRMRIRRKIDVPGVKFFQGQRLLSITLNALEKSGKEHAGDLLSLGRMEKRKQRVTCERRRHHRTKGSRSLRPRLNHHRPISAFQLQHIRVHLQLLQPSSQEKKIIILIFRRHTQIRSLC